MGAPHVSVTGAGVRTLGEVEQLGPETVTLCLHDNALSSMAGLCAFTRLLDVNLSSNTIRGATGCGLSALTQLSALDLSCNLLGNVDGLGELRALKRLKLRHNCIASLAGLAPASELESLDVRDNCLHCRQQLLPLGGLPKLSSLRCDLLEKGGQERPTADRIWNDASMQVGRVLIRTHDT